MNRLTTAFRIFAAIPILIILGLLSGGNSERNDASGVNYQYAASSIVFLPTVLMLLFRQKYPRWWFDWNVALTNFGYRVLGYLSLLRDEYPSTDEEQATHRFRRRHHALVAARHRLRIHPYNGSLPAVQPERMTYRHY